jgi:hypothetical protein
VRLDEYTVAGVDPGQHHVERLACARHTARVDRVQRAVLVELVIAYRGRVPHPHSALPGSVFDVGAMALANVPPQLVNIRRQVDHL